MAKFFGLGFAFGSTACFGQAWSFAFKSFTRSAWIATRLISRTDDPAAATPLPAAKSIAVNELNALTRNPVGRRRFGTIKELGAEVAAWSMAVNAKQGGADWQFHIDDVWMRLKSLDPKTPT